MRERAVIPVFVTTFGRATMLERCLKSLERFDFDVTVIDNATNGNEFRSKKSTAAKHSSTLRVSTRTTAPRAPLIRSSQ